MHADPIEDRSVVKRLPPTNDEMSGEQKDNTCNALVQASGRKATKVKQIKAKDYVRMSYEYLVGTK